MIKGLYKDEFFFKSAICFQFGYINGQKYEDGQTGTNKVPFA